MRQIAYKTNGIGQENAVSAWQGYFPCRWIEGCKKHWIGEYVAPGKRVHDRAFPGACISNQTSKGEGVFSSTLTLAMPNRPDILKLFGEMSDAILDSTTVRFEFCFAGTAHSDAAFLALELCVRSCDARH